MNDVTLCYMIYTLYTLSGVSICCSFSWSMCVSVSAAVGESCCWHNNNVCWTSY